jgi:peptidoglycan/LPS O-acetylase OafA/YrhL
VPLRADWWLYPTYLTNWLWLWKGQWPNIVGHFWSLSVEEQFYFVWPFVVLLLEPRRLLWALVTAEGLVLAGRTVWVFSTGPSNVIYLATITRMDGLLLGAACAIAVRRFRFSPSTVAYLPIAAVTLLAVFLTINKSNGWLLGENLTVSVSYALLALAFALLVLAAVLTDQSPTRLQRLLRLRVLTRFGKYAYGLYIIHVPLLYFVTRFGELVAPRTSGTPWFVDFRMVVGFAVTYGLASLSYNYFEKRFLALKDRFRPEFPVAEPVTPRAVVA